MNWIEELVESTYQAAIDGYPGCWINNIDRCSYNHLGGLVFERGDGYYVKLTEEQFRAQMRPT
jgi:hypothetical protein